VGSASAAKVRSNVSSLYLTIRFSICANILLSSPGGLTEPSRESGTNQSEY
jgi:hypothetical protein